MIGAYVLSGVEIRSFGRALLVALVLGFLNATLGTLMNILAFPVTLLTLGLFTFVIDAMVILLAAWLIKGFKVKDFWSALLLTLVVSLSQLVFQGIYS